jgi:hypothetical protein
MFPFLHSTNVYPEWPIAALGHVSDVVAAEVQTALMNLDAYTNAGKALDACNAAGGLVSSCQTAAMNNTPRCDTTQAFATFAFNASVVAHIARFRSLMSYYQVDTMHQSAGISKQNDQGKWACVKAATLYDGLDCPIDEYKITESEFNSSCAAIGLPCKAGFSCFCKPCVRAYEVSVFESGNGNAVTSSDWYVNGTQSLKVNGCSKMSLCGQVEQTRLVTFTAIDNKQRPYANVTAVVHVGQNTINMPVTKSVKGNFTYTFDFSQNAVGVAVMEIFFDGLQIPESPLRVEIIARNCDTDYPGRNMAPDQNGICMCGSGNFELGSKCVR